MNLLKLIVDINLALSLGMTAFLLATVLLIARLYEVKTGVRTGYRFLAVPIGACAAAGVLLLLTADITSGVIAASFILLIVGAGVTIFFGFSLYKKMTEVK